MDTGWGVMSGDISDPGERGRLIGSATDLVLVGGHWRDFAKAANRLRFYAETDRFLGRYLGGDAPWPWPGVRGPGVIAGPASRCWRAPGRGVIMTWDSVGSWLPVLGG